MEYYAEKETFRKQTEATGMQRKVKRGDAWFPIKVGKRFYNGLNQLCIEVFRTQDSDIEHNFECGRRCCSSGMLMVETRRVAD